MSTVALSVVSLVFMIVAALSFVSGSAIIDGIWNYWPVLSQNPADETDFCIMPHNREISIVCPGSFTDAFMERRLEADWTEYER